MASVTVNPPKTPVTKGSSGIAAATTPNVCKMPGPPAPFVPTPLPNIGKSGDSPDGYSTSVTIEGDAVAIQGASFKSMGDVASQGTGGGIVSNNVQGPTKFVAPGSMDVKIEGKNVQYLGDQMSNNNGPGGSPPNAATLAGVVQPCGTVIALVGDEPCPLCGKTHGDAGKVAETADTKAAAATLQAAARTAAGAAKKSAMLGVVQCGCGGKVYAASSGRAMGKLAQSTPGGWHIADWSKANTEKPDLAKMQSLVDPSKRDEVARAFVEATARREARNGSPTRDTDEPYNEPGNCAAQQAVVLALDHGCVPTGLTERYFDSRDPAATVMVYHRTDPAQPRLGTPKHFGGDQAVPPCGTCQIILPMLLCPDDKAPPCKPKAPPGASHCKSCS